MRIVRRGRGGGSGARGNGRGQGPERRRPGRGVWRLSPGAGIGSRGVGISVVKVLVCHRICPSARGRDAFGDGAGSARALSGVAVPSHACRAGGAPRLLFAGITELLPGASCRFFVDR